MQNSDDIYILTQIFQSQIYWSDFKGKLYKNMCYPLSMKTKVCRKNKRLLVKQDNIKLFIIL